MEDDSPPTKRAKYDFTTTFDVVVGKAPSSQRFTVHNSVLTSRSGFLKAARKPEWLEDPAKPTYLEDEKPEVFSRYLNCVYFGVEALQLDEDIPEDDSEDTSNVTGPKLQPDAFHCSEQDHAARSTQDYKQQGKYLSYVDKCFRIVLELYLLADKLQDFETANLVIDDFIRLGEKFERNPSDDDIILAYGSTVHGNPLRKWMRDTRVYDLPSSQYMNAHVAGHPSEFTRDVMVEFLRLKDYNTANTVGEAYKMGEKHGMNTDKCHYHQHNADHPRCVPEPKE